MTGNYEVLKQMGADDHIYLTCTYCKQSEALVTWYSHHDLYLCCYGKSIGNLEEWIRDHLRECRRPGSTLGTDPGFTLTTEKTAEHPSNTTVQAKMEALRMNELDDWLRENFPKEYKEKITDGPFGAIEIAIHLLSEFRSRREGHLQF
jgi:hypothetical protein